MGAYAAFTLGGVDAFIEVQGGFLPQKGRLAWVRPPALRFAVGVERSCIRRNPPCHSTIGPIIRQANQRF